MRLICADCGTAIQHECAAQPGAPADADAQIAQGSKTETKDGRQGYNQGYPEPFLHFWNIYPRHRDKRKALKAWRNAIRRAAIDEINDGAIRYRNDPNRAEEFTKYAEGWLNGDGWEDEPLPVRTDNGRPVAPVRPITFHETTEPDPEELAAFAAAVAERPWKAGDAARASVR